MLYTLEITREARKSPDGKDRTLEGGDISFEFSDSFCVSEDGVLTEQGYKVITSMLTTSIGEIAKTAAENGYSEGRIISEAIKQLEFVVANDCKSVPGPNSFKRESDGA